MVTSKRKAFADLGRNLKSLKKPRLHRHPPRQRAPRSWDSSSHVWLTPHVLEEHERRSADCPLSPVPTVQTSLQRFARNGGPDISEIRGYNSSNLYVMNPPRNSNRTRNPRAAVRPNGRTPIIRPRLLSMTMASGKTSAYDRNFEQHLVDNKIFLNNRLAPKNLAEITSRLSQPRPSLSLSTYPEEEFQKFWKACDTSLTEAKVMSAAIPIMVGTTSDIPSAENLIFNNLKPLTDGSLVAAKPDLYDGTRPENIHPHVRGELGSVILPSTTHNAPALPNFFIEAKGPDGIAGVAKRQACYDGALGARGMACVQKFGGGPISDSNAVTITSTFNDGNLKLYAVHLTGSRSPEGPKYHMTQLRSFAMTDQLDSFLQGVRYLRNARDWAMEQRDKAVRAANLRVPLIRISRIEPIDLHDASRGAALANAPAKRRQSQRIARLIGRDSGYPTRGSLTGK